MPELISPIDGDEVRAALDPTGLLLDEESLPDEVINRRVYAGVAAGEILRLDPLAAGYEGDKLDLVTNALNLLTASIIAPFITQIVREKVDELSTDYDKINWQARGAALAARAYSELSAARGTVPLGNARMPIFFTTGKARRY